MNVQEIFFPTPVIILISLGAAAVIALVLSKIFEKDVKVVKSKWNTSKAVEKPVFRGDLTKSEVAKHNKRSDAWIIVDGKVYDVTTYVDLHPGGDFILNKVGDDSSVGFHGSQHPPTVVDVIQEYYIGNLVD